MRSHCKPLTLKIINESGGKYLVGLKENQKQLKKKIKRAMENQAICVQKKESAKNNGRNQNFGSENIGENKVSEQKSPIRRFC
jgi:hypothetical protein